MRDEMRFKGVKVGNVDIRIDAGEFFQLNVYRRDADGNREQVATAVCDWGSMGRVVTIWKIYKEETPTVEPYLTTDDFDACLSVLRSSFGEGVEITGLVEFTL